ncbi:MAG: hypothetical protein N2V78_01205 [Methanophagales archaeon]|nr:hypothetical protein [Methanophagales archaeon]MCW3141646.1 hypothetical protein [Methanophagales archaeon]
MERLETEEERSRVYAEFVDRLEKFVTRKRKWNHHAVKKDFFGYGKEYILSKLS